MDKVFGRDPLKKKRSVQPVDPSKELLNVAGNKINQIVGTLEDKTGIKIKRLNADDDDEEDEKPNNENNDNNSKDNKS